MKKIQFSKSQFIRMAFDSSRLITIGVLFFMEASFVVRGQATKASDPKTAQSPEKETTLERTHLMNYLDDCGKIQTVQSVNEWIHRRKSILQAVESIMGNLPGDEKRCDLDVVTLEEVDCGSHVRRLITYNSEPGSKTPAYLLIPKSALNDKIMAPAVLCLHPTENLIGHKVVVGLGGLPNRQYAQELAEQGFVTLAPAYPLLANYQPDVLGLGYESGSMKAIWDNIRGVDLLLSLPYVKQSGVGAIGHSLGGHNSIYTAVFDERIKVIVSSCGFDSYLDYYSGNPEVWNAGKGWTQLRYIPNLAEFKNRLEEIPFDFHELVGALAPRHLMISAPLGDSNFNWDSVDRIVEAAMPVYNLHGAGAHLIVEHPDCDHDFPLEMRNAAYQLLMEVLD